MKRIVGVELSHQKAPLAIREKISFSAEDVKATLLQLKEQMDEVFIISTCNRLAVYALTNDLGPILQFFRRFGPMDPYLAIYDHDTLAIRHLFSTASGLESQALGEHEILGQIKKAYNLAQEVKSIGAVMDEFIRRAIFVGKKVRKETAIGQYPVSLASVSFDIIRSVCKDISRLKVLVLGTGEMSNLVMKIISKKSPSKLYIASRTFDRAEAMQHMFGGQAIRMETIAEVLSEVDVIIGATHTSHYVVKMDNFRDFEKMGQKLMIDLGLPRNFDPDLKLLPKVQLYDLDDMKSMTYQGLLKRQEEVPKANGIVEQEMQEFVYWLNTRQISPVISSYYEKLEKIREEELQWALPKLGELDDRQQKIIENLLSRVTRRMSGKPIEKLRYFSQDPQAEKNPIETFRELFDL